MSAAGVSQLPAKHPHPGMRSSKASDCSIRPRGDLDLGCRPNSRDWASTTTSIFPGWVQKQDVSMGKPQGSLEVRPLCPVGIRTKVAIVTFISTTGPPNIVVVSQGNTPETKSGAQSHPRQRYRQIRTRHRPQREQRPLSRHGEISHLEMVKSRLVMGCGAVRRPPRRLMACEIDLDSAELCSKRRQEGLMSDAGTWQESAIEGTIRGAEDGEVLAVIRRGRMESELRDRVVCLSRLSLSQSLLRLSRSGIRSGLTARPRWSRRG